MMVEKNNLVLIEPSFEEGCGCVSKSGCGQAIYLRYLESIDSGALIRHACIRPSSHSGKHKSLCGRVWL
jgi:hypothetical protein